MNRNTVSPLVIVVLFGLLLQIGLISLDCHNSRTPGAAAVSYAKAYYKLDPAMADLLCDPAPADNYIYKAVRDAGERGFSEKIARYALSRVETRTEYLDNNNAVVHLTAHRRLAINPVYAYVAWVFQMGESHEVEAQFQVQRMDGSWLICDASLPLL